MPAFLTRHIGPLPVWAYIVVVVIGGVVFYLWWRHYTNTNAANQAQSTSGVAGANQNIDPLNPTNDPNIDPNTGVPYQLEEAINPNTGEPYYYSAYGTPGTSSSPATPLPSSPTSPPTTPAPTAPPAAPAPAAPAPALPALSAAPALSASVPSLPPAAKPAPPPPPKPAPSLIAPPPPKNSLGLSNNTGTVGKPIVNSVGTTVKVPVGVVNRAAIGAGPSSGDTYTFRTIGPTGQTEPLSHVARQKYGVRGTQAVNDATQAIINANPNLRGKGHHYQPPAGTTIVLP